MNQTIDSCWDGDFVRGIGKLRGYDLVYDILVFPKQLPAAIELVSRFPELRFVLDHIAKPDVRGGTLSPWREHITELAQAPNVWCKVSGMITEAKWGSWQPGDFRPYLDTVVEVFGWDRLLYGSDWPVCLLAGSYAQVFELVETYLQQHPASAAPDFFGETAQQVYGI
jgi:L-fuconolactonase